MIRDPRFPSVASVRNEKEGESSPSPESNKAGKIRNRRGSMPRWTVSPTTRTTLSSHRSFRIVLSLFPLFLCSSLPRRCVPALLFSSLFVTRASRANPLSNSRSRDPRRFSLLFPSLIKLDPPKTNKPNYTKKTKLHFFFFLSLPLLLHFRGSTRPRAPVYASRPTDRIKIETRLNARIGRGDDSRSRFERGERYGL